MTIGCTRYEYSPNSPLKFAIGVDAYSMHSSPRVSYTTTTEQEAWKQLTDNITIGATFKTDEIYLSATTNSVFNKKVNRPAKYNGKVINTEHSYYINQLVIAHPVKVSPSLALMQGDLNGERVVAIGCGVNFLIKNLNNLNLTLYPKVSHNNINTIFYATMTRNF